jgi:phenol 2-monooxygenase
MWSTLFSGKPRTIDNDDGVSEEELLRFVSRKYLKPHWLTANSIHHTNGGFVSGIGIHYGSSAITNGVHQQCAPHLIIGKRMPPQIFIRAADARPYEIQDMLPSDTRFKLLFFVGDLTEERIRELDALSNEMRDPSCFLQKYGYPEEEKAQSMFSIITIMSGDKEDVEFTQVPALLRPHWSKYVLPRSILRLCCQSIFIVSCWMTATSREA